MNTNTTIYDIIFNIFIIKKKKNEWMNDEEEEEEDSWSYQEGIV